MTDDDYEWRRLRIAAERRIACQETREAVLKELWAMGRMDVVLPLRRRLAANDLAEHLFRGGVLSDPPQVIAELMGFTSFDREAQRRSFAFGNASISNPAVTREMIDEVADSMMRQQR